MPMGMSEEIWKAYQDHRQLFGDCVFEIALYQPIWPPGDTTTHDFVGALRMYGMTRDSYCPECKDRATFRFEPTDEAKQALVKHEKWRTTQKDNDDLPFNMSPFNYSGIFEVVAACTRARHHVVTAFFQGVYGKKEDGSSVQGIEKIGQTPSLLEFKRGGLNELGKTLGKEKAKELAAARVLASHGYSVGAFTYLRRIFEHLINKVESEVPTPAAWLPDEFAKADMPTKIQLLRGHLPKELVSNADLYKVLSEGVHNLTERQCGDYYGTVEKGIVLIAEDITRTKTREAEKAEFLNAIQKLRESLKAPLPPTKTDKAEKPDQESVDKVH
jgi:hypothetical protein